jgi:hypothetical protein
MSALAAEAFINELAEWTDMTTAYLESGVSVAYDLLRDVANSLAEIEADRGSTALKYQITAKILSGSTFRRGEAPFQDFRNLLSLRDLLVHLRPRDEVGPQGDVVPSSKLIRDFRQAGRTRTRGRQPGQDIPGGMSWLMEIQTDSMAAWAYKAGTEIIRALGKMLPEGGPGSASINVFRRTTQNIPA